MTVKEIRAITGLSQRKFAEKYGLNKRTLQNWEGGANRPPQGFEKLLLRAVMDDQEKEDQRMGQMKLIEQELYEPNPEPIPEPEPEPEETKSTESSTGYTEEQEILSTALSYLDDAEITCKDCIHDKENKCDDYECCIQNWKDYDKLIDIFGKLGVKHE